MFRYNVMAYSSLAWLLVFVAQADEETKALKAQTYSEVCPAAFYTLPIIPEARFCQQFLGAGSSSLSYHSSYKPADAKAFYLTQLGKAQSQKQHQGRSILKYQQGQHIVVVSKDGEGSQVDILLQSSLR